MRILLISSVVFVALAGAYAVFAQEEPAVEFPVAELGNCQSKEECEVYCKDGAHIEECIAFAEAAGFMSQEELEDAKRVAPLMARGEMPGGCRPREEGEAD